MGRKVFLYGWGVSLALLACSCGVYSFRDSSIPPGVKTILVRNFVNRAALVQASLANNLTNEFKSKVQQQTRLLLVNEGRADYEVNGYIAQYNVTTSGMDGQQVNQNQLQIIVHVAFINHLEKTLPEVKSFEEDMTLARQYSAQLSLVQAEAELLPSMTREMAEMLLNKVFSNW